MWELQFEIETSCSLNCIHCSSLEMRQQEMRSYTDDDLLNFVKLFESSLHIYFTGGEPINYSRLPFLCNEIQNNTYNAKIGIYSTGNHSKQLYINEDFAKELKKSGIVDCYFSIYSDMEEEHDDWTGTKGSFINTLASINSIKKVGIIPKAHIVLTRVNYAKIDRVIEFSKSLGIMDVRILRLTSCGAAKNNWNEIGIPLGKQNQIIEYLINNKQKYSINLSFAGYPLLSPCRPFKDAKGCEAGIKLLYIDIFGDIYPCACSKGHNKICNITEREKVFDYIKSQNASYRLTCLNAI